MSFGLFRRRLRVPAAPPLCSQPEKDCDTPSSCRGTGRLCVCVCSPPPTCADTVQHETPAGTTVTADFSRAHVGPNTSVCCRAACHSLVSSVRPRGPRCGSGLPNPSVRRENAAGSLFGPAVMSQQRKGALQLEDKSCFRHVLLVGSVLCLPLVFSVVTSCFLSFRRVYAPVCCCQVIRDQLQPRCSEDEGRICL